MKNRKIIELSNINKLFMTEEVETSALSDISLTIRQGEYVSISGPSGCGKSTLLSVLGLMDSANTGLYKLDGIDSTNLDDDERSAIRNKHVGFIFQAFNLIGDLTVAENVELPLTYRSEISVADRRKKTEVALKQVNMEHRAQHYPSQLSGGQQQRVAVARAIAGSPSIILADEPTGNLDMENAGMVLDLLEKLHAQGATICMVTHDPRSEQCAQRVINLLDGKIIRDQLQTRSAVA